MFRLCYKESHNENALAEPFDKELGREIIRSAPEKFEGWKVLQMFQNILASSVGSITYVFGTRDSSPSEPVILQHYNRVFIVKDNNPDTMHVHAACGRQIPKATMDKRRAAYAKNKDVRLNNYDPIAKIVLKAAGVECSTSASGLGPEKDAIVQKIKGIEEDWNVIIVNEDLTLMEDNEIKAILDRIDYEKYEELLCASFTKNWKNDIPGIGGHETKNVDPGIPVEEWQKEQERLEAEKAARKTASAKKPRAKKKTEPAPVPADNAVQETTDATPTVEKEATDTPAVTDGFPMPAPIEDPAETEAPPKMDPAAKAVMEQMLASVNTELFNAIAICAELENPKYGINGADLQTAKDGIKKAAEAIGAITKKKQEEQA